MFEDIKVNDIVYTQDAVYPGNRETHKFWTPKKVTKVTKTQFTLDDGTQFKKGDGVEIGTPFYKREARKLGDYYGRKMVKDQSEEKEEFVKKVHAFRQARESLKKIYVDINHENFDEIVATIKKLEELTGVNND